MREAGREELALELLRSAAAADPDLAFARLRLGEELLEAGYVGGALAELAAARELAPSDLRTLVSLAEARLRAGELGEAEELCRRALGLAPGYRGPTTSWASRCATRPARGGARVPTHRAYPACPRPLARAR